MIIKLIIQGLSYQDISFSNILNNFNKGWCRQFVSSFHYYEQCFKESLYTYLPLYTWASISIEHFFLEVEFLGKKTQFHFKCDRQWEMFISTHSSTECVGNTPQLGQNEIFCILKYLLPIRCTKLLFYFAFPYLLRLKLVPMFIGYFYFFSCELPFYILHSLNIFLNS